MDRRDRPATSPEGRALDLGDLDWTIPPDTQPGSLEGWNEQNISWVAKRFRAAMTYAVLAMTLTGLALGWWIASGSMPTTDPQVGVLALLLHVLAFITAWIALRASVDTWQALYLNHNQHSASPPKANLTQVVSLAAAAVMCFHAAMVVSSILS